ncbi:MAG: ComF family protein [Clostridia bacterium]|nr:ComF family protein [Clostridia bacterium]
MHFKNQAYINLCYSQAISMIISLFFPKVCGICKKKINQKYTCEKCSNILKYTMKKELCVRKIDSYVDKLVSLFQYKDFIRSKILEFKFDGKPYIGNTFAELMCSVMQEKNIVTDILVPVPIHKRRYIERGYNQSELLAKFISKKMNVKYNAKLLKKTRNNIAQSTLNRENRMKNVTNVYKVNSKYNICGKSVLLIDDIYTTGATAKECAKVLKQSGAKEVVCFTVAYSKGNY